MKRYGKRLLFGILLTLSMILQTSCGLFTTSQIPVESLENLIGEIQESNIVILECDVVEVGDVEIIAGSGIPGENASDGERFVELPVKGNYYYDLENVVLHLEIHGELPDNYITKSEARKLGWEGGSVEKYQEGAAIGGDRFGNREGLLPEADGRDYTECDLDTNGQDSRGAKRLVFSDDGLYFYTEDHYESFEEVIVLEGYEVVW